MSHTPGPWTVSAKSKYLVRTKKYRICKVFKSELNPSLNKAAEADACLIAAAPDLLAALKHVMKNLAAAYLAGSYQLPPSTIAIALDSIDKAEGKLQGLPARPEGRA